MNTGNNQTRPIEAALKELALLDLEDGRVSQFYYRSTVGPFGEDHTTAPGRLADEIKSKGERGFQRALLNAESLHIKATGKPEKITWFDIELPVVFSKNTPRRNCVDLIGEWGSSKVMCELKFATDTNKGRATSPIYALAEVLYYYHCVLRNMGPLDEYKVHHKDQKVFDWVAVASHDTRLVVLANALYWNYWRKRESAMAILNKAISIVEQHTKLNIILLEMSDPTIANLPEGDNEYKPELAHNLATPVVLG